MASANTSSVSAASSLEEPQLTSWHVDPAAAAKLTGQKRREYTSLVKELADHIVDLGKELRCPVCLSLMGDPTQCPCGHVFCKACILQALSIAKHCPLCRTKCTKRELSVSFVYQGIISTYRAIQPEGMDVGSEVRLVVFFEATCRLSTSHKNVQFTQPTTFSQICGAMIGNDADSSFESACGAAATTKQTEAASGAGQLPADNAAYPQTNSTKQQEEATEHLFDSDDDDILLRPNTCPAAGALPALPTATTPAISSTALPNTSAATSSTTQCNSHDSPDSAAQSESSASEEPPISDLSRHSRPRTARASRGAKQQQSRRTAHQTSATPHTSSSSRQNADATAMQAVQAAEEASAVHGLLASVVVLVENIPRQYQKQLEKLQEALGDGVMRIAHTWSPEVTHCIVPVKAVPDPRGDPVLSEGGGKRRRSGGRGAARVVVARRRSDAYLLSLAHGAELVSPDWISAGVAEKPYVLVAEAPYRLAGDEESLKNGITASALLNAGPAAALKTVADGTPRPLHGWWVAMCGLFQYPIPIEKNTATLLQAMGAQVLLPGSDEAAFTSFVHAASAAMGASSGLRPSVAAAEPGLVLLLDDSKQPCAIPKFLEGAVATRKVQGIGTSVYAPSVRWLLDVICTFSALEPDLQEFEATFRVTAASAAQHT